MKSKVGGSIRWKIIGLIIFSIALSVLGVKLVLGMAHMLYDIPVFPAMFDSLAQIISIESFSVISGILLFTMFFFIFTQNIVQYLEEINLTLKRIAEGDLDIKIPVRSADELGELAENINRMTAQLKNSIEDERNAEKLKMELVTSVSHDLRTPLTSILGYLGLIVGRRYKNEKGLLHYAQISFNKSQQLKQLIDELFEFTLLSYGGVQMKISEIDLAEMLNQLIEEFLPVFQDSGLECRLSLDKEAFMAIADGDMLARVFDNLLMNALRYGSNGKYVDIALAKENSMAVITITNYGVTIPADKLPFVFEKFYRVETSRSEATGGTGLGLAIAKNIVELHGGNISVSSIENKTTFTVALKLLKP